MSAPLTPLGARTPHAHPALAWVTGILALIIATGVVVVFTRDVADTNTPVLSPSPSPTTTFGYKNERYGFAIDLPNTWQGFTVEEKTWNGILYDEIGTQTKTDTGPEIILHYPGSNDQNPHEAMPIMVFTLAQWEFVRAGDASPPQPFMSVGAAPFGPSELARNTAYVFALPARYNYDFAPGFQEVDQLVHTLRAFPPTP